MSVTSQDSEDKLNTELNLVPFIDLLSSLVLFLLITAVWMQIGTIPASVESKGKSRVAVNENTRVQIHMTVKGIDLSWPPAVTGPKPRFLKPVAGGFDYDQLLAVLELAAKKNTSPIVVAVSSEDAVAYGQVIQAIDTAKKAGFGSVALSTN
jgi:biopolymer transport protein TolR